MTVFNVELFGSDADWFCGLTSSEQISWIKNNTNQTDDALINEFLSVAHNRVDYCFTCKDNKKRVSIAKIAEHGNFSNGNEQEVGEINDSTFVKRPRKRRDN